MNKENQAWVDQHFTEEGKKWFNSIKLSDKRIEELRTKQWRLADTAGLTYNCGGTVIEVGFGHKPLDRMLQILATMLYRQNKFYVCSINHTQRAMDKYLTRLGFASCEWGTTNAHNHKIKGYVLTLDGAWLKRSNKPIVNLQPRQYLW